MNRNNHGDSIMERCHNHKLDKNDVNYFEAKPSDCQALLPQDLSVLLPWDLSALLHWDFSALLSISGYSARLS